MDLGGFNKPPKTGNTPTQSTPNKPDAMLMLNHQVMSATKGATEAFSGVTSHLSKLGAKNTEVGAGFGRGLGVKPGFLSQIQSSIAVGVTKMMMKFGMIPSLPFSNDVLQGSIQSGISTIAKNSSSPGNMAEKVTKGLPVSQLTQLSSSFKTSSAFKDNALDSKFGNQTVTDDKGGSVQSSEKDIHQMVMEHQRIIEELVEEKGKLRQILVEDLKVPSTKLEASFTDRNIPNSFKGEDDRNHEQSKKTET